MTPQSMSQEDLQDAAGAILTACRTATDSPASGCYALAIALYTLWRYNRADVDFPGFLDDFVASMKDLHMINDVKGMKQ